MSSLSILLVFVLSSIALPQSRTVKLGDVGEIRIPQGFVHRIVGRTDSLLGEIRRSDGSLTISYDIGPLSGIQMHPKRRPDCVWFREKVVRGRDVFIGLLKVREENVDLIITIKGNDGSTEVFLPANFRAAVGSKVDIADVERIAMSFAPSQNLR